MMGRICLCKWSLIRAAMVEPAASHLRHAGLVHPSQRDPFGPPRAGRTGAHRRCREQSLCHLDGLRSGQGRACLGEAARFRPMRALNRASTCHSNQTPSPGARSTRQRLWRIGAGQGAETTCTYSSVNTAPRPRPAMWWRDGAARHSPGSGRGISPTTR
jgi:hypothetical protein